MSDQSNREGTVIEVPPMGERGVGGGGTGAVFTTCTTSVDEGRLRFEVEVREGDRTIGVGTHERRVVDRAGFK